MESYNNVIRLVGGGLYSSKYGFHRSFDVFQSFYKDEILCDIKLQTDDGKIINGHKVILASASPYFQALFTNTNFEESCKESVIIQQFDSTALRLIVDFIYTNKIKVTEGNVQVLLFAANFLQIKHVQDACCYFLQTQLRPTNCCSIMSLAELYGCKKLLSSCEFFILQHFSDVVLDDDFLSISPEQVIKLISSDKMIVPSEEIVFESVIKWVKHDSDSRKDILPKLMENVRLPLTSKYFLHEKVEKEPLVNHSLECKNYIIEALHYQLLKVKCEAPGTLTKSIRTKPRLYTGLPKVILVLGGYHLGAYGIEWYDPTTNVWQYRPELVMRSLASFVVLKDKYVFSIGGAHGDNTVNVLDLSSSSSWVSKVPMITKRQCPGVAVLDNCIYAVGGCNTTGELSSAEVFDCNTEEWRMIPNMSNRRYMHGVGVLDNLLYAVGGFDGMDNLKSVECYDPSTNIWKPVAEMYLRRSAASIGVLNGLLYAIGGHDNDDVILESAEVYNPNTQTWTIISDMNVPRQFAGVVTFEGLLYVMGGENETCINSGLNSVEVYNPSTDTWSMFRASMNIARCRFGAFIVDKPIF